MIGIALCLWLSLVSAQRGFARLLANYSTSSNILAAAQAAVQIEPRDAENHYAEALNLLNTERRVDAVKALERAALLRPDDYYLWLELGRAQDEIGDEQGAVNRLKRAVELAPYYAQPRWQLGNVLFRMGAREQALVELRRAAASDAQLFPAFINLMWQATKGNGKIVRQIVEPQSSYQHLTLARELVRHGDTENALELFRLIDNASEAQSRLLMTDMLTAKQFAAAFELWQSIHRGEQFTTTIARIVDPGFEQEIVVADPGFGWQAAPVSPHLSIALDPNQPHSGTYSLFLTYKGEAAIGLAAVSQRVIVRPNTRYRLAFVARTQDMVTLGAPVVEVVDAANPALVLAQSEALGQRTTDWKSYAVDFTAPETATAVTLRIRRAPCLVAPCSIFGKVWFDNFQLTPLS